MEVEEVRRGLEEHQQKLLEITRRAFALGVEIVGLACRDRQGRHKFYEGVEARCPLGESLVFRFHTHPKTGLPYVSARDINDHSIFMTLALGLELMEAPRELVEAIKAKYLCVAGRDEIKCYDMVKMAWDWAIRPQLLKRWFHPGVEITASALAKLGLLSEYAANRPEKLDQVMKYMNAEALDIHEASHDGTLLVENKVHGVAEVFGTYEGVFKLQEKYQVAEKKLK